jgi:TetR/AcrR family transcriptional repressor of lmrAB and yxaGH operons
MAKQTPAAGSRRSAQGGAGRARAGARAAPATGPRRDGEATREAFVTATARLLQRQGYAASGLNEIVAASGAPRGSLYFHFPGGKEQLARTAIQRAGSALAAAIEALLAAHDDLGAALAALVDALAAGLRASDYAEGCPVATVTLETASSSGHLRAAAAEAFDSWLAPLRARLQAAGMRAPEAERRAILILSAIEGALILARARHSQAPLVAVREELLAMTAAWCAPPKGGARRQRAVRAWGAAMAGTAARAAPDSGGPYARCSS